MALQQFRRYFPYSLVPLTRISEADAWGAKVAVIRTTGSTSATLYVYSTTQLVEHTVVDDEEDEYLIME